MTVWGWLFLALIWLVSLGTLEGQAFVRSSAFATGFSKEWMGVYVHGHKIGYATTQATRTSDGFLIQERATLRLLLQGTDRHVKTRINLRTDPAFQIRSFHMRVTSGAFISRMKGTLREGCLVLQLRSADTVRRHEIRVDEVPWMTQNLRYRFSRKSLRPGDRYTVSLFDPLTLTCKPLDIVVEGMEPYRLGDKTLNAFRLFYSWNGLKGCAWMSEQGEMLREEGFGGLTLVREKPEKATTMEGVNGRSVDLIREISIHVKTPLPSPRDLSYLKVRFSGAALKDYAFSDHRQKTQGQDVEVFREDLNSICGNMPLNQNITERGALAPTPFIQSDAPQIEALANGLTTGTNDALECVQRIMRWVHRNLNKAPTVSVPSAVEVLQRKEGDCNEHAVLFAALTRAIGIPSKICAGIVYMNGRFFYHAWNAVYLGAWVSVDPTLGQVPADATHVKFAEGGIESQIRITPLIGILRAEILDYK